MSYLIANRVIVNSFGRSARHVMASYAPVSFYSISAVSEARKSKEEVARALIEEMTQDKAAKHMDSSNPPPNLSFSITSEPSVKAVAGSSDAADPTDNLTDFVTHSKTSDAVTNSMNNLADIVVNATKLSVPAVNKEKARDDNEVSKP